MKVTSVLLVLGAVISLSLTSCKKATETVAPVSPPVYTSAK